MIISIAAVLRPEKEKSQFLTFVRGLGSKKLDGSPLIASLSIAGPPGYPRSSALATLSKHSPAESSIVDPKVINFDGFLTTTRAVLPPDTSKHRYGNFISLVNLGESRCACK